MLAPLINNHVQQALARLLQQYKQRPLLAALITSLVVQIQDLENAIFALDAGRQLWNGTNTPAVGMQLDEIGTIVGISRNGLDDATYLLFIFGKIAENFSDTTTSTILNVIGYVFQAQQVIVQDIYPAGISVQVIGTPISPSLYLTAANLVQQSLGAGINLVFVGGSPSQNVFRFDGPGIVGAINGYSDLNNPSIGGDFVGLIA